uniref:PALP domain-containing protein n=1 Tax=Panagrellus redivivus TaxID=6233 RepID=A0A7E4UNB6_PANRE
MLALILLGLVTTAAGTLLTLSPTHQDHCKVDQVLWRQKAVLKMWDERRLMKPTPLKFYKVPGMPHIEMFFKDESESRTSNLKHRMAWSLIMWGLIEGHIKQNIHLYEASSGSTALSLAYMARIIGIKFTAVLPDSVPLQTIEKIRQYGAEAMKVPTAMMFDRATELAKKNRGFFLNQFANADKAEDYHATDYLKYDSINIMHEIVKQFKAMKKREPHYFVHTAGTGGMITSVGRYVLKAGLNTKVVLADTQFSIYYDYVINNKFTKESGLYNWQGPGIPGAGFGNTGPAVEGVTTSLHRNVIDIAYKIPDLASVAAMHFLKDNGIRGGVSTGLNFLAALSIGANNRSKGEKIRIVPIIGDKAEIYQNTYLNNKFVDARFHTQGGQKVFDCWKRVIKAAVTSGKDPLKLGAAQCKYEAGK